MPRSPQTIDTFNLPSAAGSLEATITGPDSQGDYEIEFDDLGGAYTTLDGLKILRDRLSAVITEAER